MSSPTPASPAASSVTGAQAVIASLMQHGITRGFGIPSIHNIAIYEVLRRVPAFQHWVVRHEQAAGYAADGFYRRSGKTAAIFASTGPGNLLTLVPLLESLQTSTPVVLIGTNVATPVLGRSCAALHETPHQLEIIRPLTRFATRITAPEMIPGAIAAAAAAGGPAFIEIPHDLLLAPLPATAPSSPGPKQPLKASEADLRQALAMIQKARKPALVVGSSVTSGGAVPQAIQLAEALQSPVLTTTSGKGVIADDHPLAMGCLSRLGAVVDLMKESDLLIGIGARLTEFDTSRFSLRLPENYLQIDDDPAGRSDFFVPSCRVTGDLAATVQSILAGGTERRQAWWDVASARKRESERIAAFQTDSYAALMLLRQSLDRNDVVVNDQSILNYWASAFFPVMEPQTFLYPSGSGTLGYGLPAAIGAACAGRQQGKPGRVVCIAGDGGFQYTAHELATLAQYQLPVKLLLVNDNAYGVIGFLQRNFFGQTHEVQLKNPDFCALAGAYGISAQRVTDLAGLTRAMRPWLDSEGPSLLEWKTELKAPWEIGAINRLAEPAAG